MTKRILILEDDLETVRALLERFPALKKELNLDFSVVVLAEWQDAELYNTSTLKFDLILLDRDCNAGGSFHALDLERFGVEKVVSISSIPQWNDEAVARGVKRVVWKNYSDLPTFVNAVVAQIRQVLSQENKSA